MAVEKIGRYEIVGELGRGAMGVVYKATDPTIGRTVALKTMRLDVHAEKYDEMLRRFQHEARAAGALSHPNIVTIYDAHEAEGVFYIAMEYIEGTTLAQLLYERKSLSAQEVVDFGTQVCTGLQYAHFRKVIHRDIKPPNIMIAPAGVKIMDFGIAKAGASLTNAGEVLGTPHYMSPEQVRGRELDGRSDIFSMGVMLYEMITGEKPFAGQNVTTVIYKIVNEQPVPPRELDVSIHPGLSMIISKCLAKDPEDRYQEASDLATALKSYKIVSIPQQFSTGTQPMEARPSPPAPSATPAVTQHISSGTKALPAQSPSTQVLPTQLVEPPRPTPVARTAAAATLATARSTTGNGMATVRRDSSDPSRKTLVLFSVLAAVLIVGALGIRAFHAKRNAPVSQAVLAPVPPDTPETTPAATSSANEPPRERPNRITTEQPANVKIPATPASGIGDLRITSNPPGAMVTVDGVSQDYYMTPFNTPPLKSGMHTLTATMSGLPSQTREVEVVARKRVVVDFQLTGNKAIYNISSAPQGADISIDGASTGTRTPAQLPLAAGAHKITLRMEGFQPVELMTQSAPGESVNIAPRLQARNSVDISGQVASETPSLGSVARMRRPGSLVEVPEGKGAVIIRTRPRGVTIVVDGYTVPRQTPLRFPIRTGSHTIVLQKPGFQSITRVIQVEEGQVTEIDEPLTPQ
jgi:serine/threonine protein kinase